MRCSSRTWTDLLHDARGMAARRAADTVRYRHREAVKVLLYRSGWTCDQVAEFMDRLDREVVELELDDERGRRQECAS